MRIAVLGASGAMGSYFAWYFAGHGHQVIVYDKGRKPFKGTDYLIASSNRNAVSKATVVLLAVPLDATARVLREIATSLRKGSTVIEITSVKSDQLSEMKRLIEGKEASLLSLHPLFGGSNRMRPKICVIGDAANTRRAKNLFPDASLLPMSADFHDRLMAYELSLVHLINLAFASVISKKTGYRAFKRGTTPTSSTQLALAMSVASQSPHLYSHIELDNPHVLVALSYYIKELRKLERSIEKKDYETFEALFVAASKGFSRKELRKTAEFLYDFDAR